MSSQQGETFQRSSIATLLRWHSRIERPESRYFMVDKARETIAIDGTVDVEVKNAVSTNLRTSKEVDGGVQSESAK
jgi:hypothetical protein